MEYRQASVWEHQARCIRWVRSNALPPIALGERISESRCRLGLIRLVHQPNRSHAPDHNYFREHHHEVRYDEDLVALPWFQLAFLQKRYCYAMLFEKCIFHCKFCKPAEKCFQTKLV